MAKLPRITGKKLANALQKADFRIARSKGSHFILKHDDGRMTIVPVHSGEDIGPGLLSKILKDCDLSKEELMSLL